MKQQIHLVSLGVADVQVAKRFYCDGLGFELIADLGTVAFIQAGHSLALGIISTVDLAADMGVPAPPASRSFGSVTFAHNVGSEAEVDDFMVVAVHAGALVLKPAQTAAWGGYSGYFRDPDGHVWEVAAGGVAFDQEGKAHLE